MANGIERLQTADDLELAAWHKINGLKTPANGAEQDAYYAQKAEAIKRGEPTWVIRNLDADQGRVFDFFRDSTYVGMVDVEWDGHFDAYIGNVASYPSSSLHEAVSFVEAYPIAA